MGQKKEEQDTRQCSIKKDYEKRGHNVPVCSWECAEKLVERLKGE